MTESDFYFPFFDDPYDTYFSAGTAAAQCPAFYVLVFQIQSVYRCQIAQKTVRKFYVLFWRFVIAFDCLCVYNTGVKQKASRIAGESPEVLSGFKEDIVLLAEERFAMILDLLAQKRSATVLELCDALDASESTIRRDLTQLDRQGLLKKVHGGATLVGRTVLADEPPCGPRGTVCGRKASDCPRRRRNDHRERFIFLDAGSTTLALAAALEALPCRLPM